MHTVSLSTVVAFGLAAAPTALAWGRMAHSAVGLIAEEFLDEHARAVLPSILAAGEQLGSIASWADEVKYSRGYIATKPLHYVDSNDSPPTSCGYDDNRDCPDGKCIVGAIANYTVQAMCSSDAGYGSPQIQYEAIKFLVHFVGDITQPLHTCARDTGGNAAKVVFDGRRLNLHGMWDYSIPEKHIMLDHNNSTETYAAYLANEIRSGKYAADSSSWISPHGLLDVNGNGNSLAAIDWAMDSDARNCDAVWPGYDADPTQDFGGSYYTEAIPVVDLQIAKGGYRLADWLNHVLATCSQSN